MKAVILALSLIFAGTLEAAEIQTIERVDLTAAPWTVGEARWIHDHVGVIFYGEPAPQFSQSELIDIAHSLGVTRVKTWLKGPREGVMLETLQTPAYKRICTQFQTVLLDVCPDFMFARPYDHTLSRTIRREYEDVARYLGTTYGKGKTFLLSEFMETNLFFGTPRSHYPDFPALRFFEDATAGIKKGIEKASRDKRGRDMPRIYSVIEIAWQPRDFIRTFLPHTSADLYAISYYGRGELGQPDVWLADIVAEVSRHVPHDGPFGENNLILGELGRNVFAGSSAGADEEQLYYLRRTLLEAREAKMPFAFIFWLTDQERHLDDGWGLVSSKPTGGRLRRSWHAFQEAFERQKPAGKESRPLPVIDRIRPLEWNRETGAAVTIEADIANRSTWAQDAMASELDVRVRAGEQTRSAKVWLERDELVTLRTQLAMPSDAVVSVTLSAPGVEPVSASEPLERADITIERIYTEPEKPEAGERVRFFATCRNIGKAAITDFSVQFHVDDFTDLWVTWGSMYGEAVLRPGVAAPVGGGFLWTAEPGTHTVRAWANADGSREADYSNNRAYQTIVIPQQKEKGPDFSGPS